MAFLAGGVLLFSGGYLAGYLTSRHQADDCRTILGSRQELRQGGYRYVNPLLECDQFEESFAGGELTGLKAAVVKYLEGAQAAGTIEESAVYFRQLRDGPWFGIDEKVHFTPASLMKLPLLIAYLKEAERDPGLLDKRIMNDLDTNLAAMQNYPPAETISPGLGYTVDDLLFRMMAQSDNNAWGLLFKNIDTTKLDVILRDMDISYVPGRDDDTMTVKSYSGFLRILYNASYLSKEMSEKALELLTQEEFSPGIRRGVPQGVPVAGKYGERVGGLDRGMVRQLHEFAIVYHPRAPYLLGIMTRGRDFGSLEKVIGDVSGLIYTGVDGGKTGG